MEIGHINFTPTMRCNLKCKYCGVLVPQYPYRPQMDMKECRNTLHMLFQIIDKVGKFQITGGEPMMHPQIGEVIRECIRYSEFIDEFWLFSNCSMPIKDDVFDVLKEISTKVLVQCSDYGIHKDVADDNISKLKRYSIPYRYTKYYGERKTQDYNGWVDQGDFVAHNRSLDENMKIFSNCTHVRRGGSWYVRSGQMHWCGRSIRGMEVDRIPDVKDDYLDLFEDCTIKEKREKLRILMDKSVITACDYCNGLYGTEDDNLRVPAGGQM